MRPRDRNVRGLRDGHMQVEINKKPLPFTSFPIITLNMVFVDFFATGLSYFLSLASPAKHAVSAVGDCTRRAFLLLPHT
jgi:hypothetical protein